MPDDEFRKSDPIDPFDPWDTGPNVTGFERLQRDGVHVRAPGDVSPDQIRGCLWELVYALAAQRVFLSHTNHLDDAELYAWLHEQWLARANPPAPPESQGNDHVDILGTGTEADNEVWLRFYADEVFREIWARDFPEDSLPPCEAAPFDRDRWLPRPTLQPPTDPDEPATPSRTDGSSGTSFDELQDPLQLEAVDLEIHQDTPVFDGDESENEFTEVWGEADSADSAEELLREPAVGVETDHWRNPHAELMASGVVLPPPEELTDEALPSKLWELLHELACRGFYLLHTDHLGDRELYTNLWRHNLRQPAILPGPISGGGWYHDYVGGSSTEAVFHWLRYYANDLEREKYAVENPGRVVPPRERCPYRRDRRLPKGPF